MSGRRRARWVSRLAGAALLGAATILVPKADPAERWATPVKVVAEVQVEQAPGPGEPLPDPARRPAGGLARRR